MLQTLPFDVLVFEKSLDLDNKIFRLIYHPLVNDFTCAIFDQEGNCTRGGQLGSFPIYSQLNSWLMEVVFMGETGAEEIILGAIKIREGFQMIAGFYKRQETIKAHFATEPE